MANIDVILMVLGVVACVIGMVLFGTYVLNKKLDQSTP
jgi:uncharacterized protein YneF (UPF0154 family)